MKIHRLTLESSDLYPRTRLTQALSLAPYLEAPYPIFHLKNKNNWFQLIFFVKLFIEQSKLVR